MGWLMGNLKAPNGKQRQRVNYDFGTRLKEALKMRAFWHFKHYHYLTSAVLAAISLFAMPYLESLGFSVTTSKLIVSLFTTISLCARIPMGLLSDVIRKKYVMTGTLAFLTIGLFLFWFITDKLPSG